MKPFFWTRHQMTGVGFLLLFLGSSYFSFGQTQPTSLLNVPPPETHLEQSDNMLRWLDKSPITTGILYDRMFPLADIESFNGQLDASTSHSEHFFQSYYELHSASYNTNGRPSLEQLRASVNEAWSSNHYPIGMICFQYNVLDDNAVNDNLLQYDSGANTFSDVPGRSRSPYLTRTAMIASPLLHNFTPIMKPGIHYFHFSPQFIFTNAGVVVDHCQIDFGDGSGWHTLSLLDPSVAINYPTVGDRTIHTVAYLSNGQQLHAYSVARVAASNADDPSWADWNDGEICNQPPTVIDVTGDPFNPFQYGDGNVYGAKGKIYIYFARGNCQTKVLRKPVVFLDGFDPTNTRGHKQIYKDKINDEDQDGSQLKLGDKYRNEGLDVVIIDYEDGGDYIERNGLMVIKALEELWNRYSSTMEQNFTLIGPSMGALVGQYALAEAERRGINHHTRTYISFDGPHQGANVAIGLQQAIGYALKSKIAAPSPGNACRPSTSGLVEDDFPLNVRAAKQLLLHHYLTNQEEPTAHPYRSVFVNNMNAVGYPNNCRKVAVANGSRRADTQLAGQNLDRVMLASEEILYLRLWGNLGFRRGVDLLSWNLKATPINNRQNTLHAFTANILTKLLGLNQFRDDFARPFNYASSRSVDILPGGHLNEIQEVLRAVNENESVKFTAASVCLNIGTIRSAWGDFILRPFLQFRLKLKNGTNFTVQSNTPVHSFVPTLSAVDFRGGTPWSYNFENENLVCSGKTPFNQVYAPLTNQAHATVNSESAVWFSNEIRQENLPSGCNTGGGGGCVINKVRFVFRPDCCQDRLNGSKIQGSNDGNTWSDLYTISGNGTGSWQEFTFGNTTAYSSVRFQAGPNGHGELVELEFYNNNTKLNGTTFATGGTWDNNTAVYGYQNAFDGNAAGNMWHAANSGTNATAGLTLSGCGGCTPPAAPTLSANPSTINSGQSSGLSASNCGGTVNWSTGATGNSISVSPSATTTYTATCTVNGCTSSNGSVTVTVNGGSGGSDCLVNKVRLKFRGDCCLDRLNGAQIQGSNDGSNWTTLYTFNQNGTGSWQEFTFGNSTAFQRVRFVASGSGYGELWELEFYNNMTKLSGTAFGSDNSGNALDGNEGTFWHGSNFGTQNHAGLLLSNCNPPRIGVAGEKDALSDDTQTLELYPNPTDGKVTVRYYLEKGQKASLQFINTNGQVLLSKGLVGEGGWGQNQTDLSAQPDGVYVVRMETPEKTVSRKFVIVK